MSHYCTIETELRDPEALCRALGELGFSAAEVHDTPRPLYGYQGDRRPERAEVIIRRRHLGALSNDIGFQKSPEGTYRAIISEYDAQHGYDRAWLGRLSQAYACEMVQRMARRKGARVAKSRLPDGSVRLVLQGGRL